MNVDELTGGKHARAGADVDQSGPPPAIQRLNDDHALGGAARRGWRHREQDVFPVVQETGL